MHMPGQIEPLTTARVLATIVPLLQRDQRDKINDEASPRCPWCHGPAVWTAGSKMRCTVCGFVPS